jgi:plasmid stabilization system protein ParE
MRVRVLRLAHDSINEGFEFYESQESGLGFRFIESIMADIHSLAIYGGGHQIVIGTYHRKICGKFPFSIYYKVEHSEINVYRVFDNRRDPDWLSKQLD